MDKPRKAFVSVVTILSLVVILGLVHYPPANLYERWVELVLLFSILLFFQFRATPLAGAVKLSLSVAVYITIIFVYGIGEAMCISILVYIIHGWFSKIEWIKIYLNALHRALTSLIVGVFFGTVHSEPNLVLPTSLMPMLLALAIYTFANMLLVSLLAALLKGKPIRALLEIFTPNVWINSLLLGYVGILFSFFIHQWGLAGLLIFSILLISTSEVMGYSAGLIAEQRRRIDAEQELILDSKTKVLNYRYFRQWLDRSYEFEQVGMLFIDIDDFKLFNDLYGHEYGDKILKTVAQGIKENVRQEDEVIRFGGEEFVVILPNADRVTALQIAKRVQRGLTGISHHHVTEPQLTVSIGVAAYPEDAKDRLDLLREADMAMYRAKSRGKNQCCTAG